MLASNKLASSRVEHVNPVIHTLEPRPLLAFFPSTNRAVNSSLSKGVTFKAHRLILAACSKHFQDLFERAPLCPSVLVILDGTSSSNMSALLEFMYKGEVKGLSIEHEKLAVVQGQGQTSHSSTVSHDSQLDSPTGRKQAKISGSGVGNGVTKESLEGLRWV
uniref:BTB domain-containing protein n=1 Tax=Timema douglasi TaxID=61478 RepID=A0A7R8Z6Z8_TIMDO|nr:unnamed protein product [Timema douglasi]